MTAKAGLLPARAEPGRAGVPAAPSSITTATASWICSSPTTSISIPTSVPKPGASSNCNWKGVPVNCGPRGLPPGRCYLYRNNGDGTFTDVSDASGISKATGSYGMTAVAADFDNDGWPDIYVACDSTPSFLFRNSHDGTFTRSGPAKRRGAQRRRHGAGRHGCRASATSIWTAISISSKPISPTTPTCFTATTAKANFEDVTVRAGLGVETRYIGWGTALCDLDNDGLPGPLLRHRQASIRRWKRSCPPIPSRRRASFSAIWAAANSRN